MRIGVKDPATLHLVWTMNSGIDGCAPPFRVKMVSQLEASSERGLSRRTILASVVNTAENTLPAGGLVQGYEQWLATL
jgi:hypothetical protein